MEAHSGTAGSARQRPPAAPPRPSKPASHLHRRCAASSRSARRPSTTAIVAPFSSWLAQPAETGVRMLLAAVFVPAGLAVLAARSLQPISRADALHTRMSGPAALHIAIPVAAVHQCLLMIVAGRSVLVGMATWILLRFSGSSGATAKSQIEEWAFAGVSRSPYKLVHLQSGLPCGRVFCTRPYSLARVWPTTTRATTTATSNGDGSAAAGVWRVAGVWCVCWRVCASILVRGEYPVN